MRRKLKFISSTKILLILIASFLIQGILFKGRFEIFKFSDHRYLYEYGTFVSKVLVYIAFVLCFFYPLIVWLKTNNNFRKNLVLMILGFIPALYFILLYVFSKPNESIATY